MCASYQRERPQVLRTSSSDGQKIEVTVELFGQARVATGQRRVTAAVPVRAGMSDLAAALLESCPRLGGLAVHEDGSGLIESYTLNVNGTAFVGEDGVSLKPGDSVLLFSSQAGG